MEAIGGSYFASRGCGYHETSVNTLRPDHVTVQDLDETLNPAPHTPAPLPLTTKLSSQMMQAEVDASKFDAGLLSSEEGEKEKRKREAVRLRDARARGAHDGVYPDAPAGAPRP